MNIVFRLRLWSLEKRWDVVTYPPWGGWNYSAPIMSDKEWTGNTPPDDSYLKDLAYMAGHGWHYYQKAYVEMKLIHPLANYKPVIHDEFRETFDAHYNEGRMMPLLLYERNGKLIMSNDWETYWLYRERKDLAVPCIILGRFNAEKQGVDVCDKPFKIERSEYLLKPQHALTTW